MSGGVRHVGFTGSRTEPSAEQVAWLREQLAILSAAGYRVLHHGDCVGGDATADKLARDLGYEIVIHPPTDERLRAHCGYGHEIRKPRPYLTRNHDIVDASEFLLALPSGQEINHSGTWATIRYADRNGTPLSMRIRDETRVTP
jgi:hypothetical protein